MFIEVDDMDAPFAIPSAWTQPPLAVFSSWSFAGQQPGHRPTKANVSTVEKIGAQNPCLFFLPCMLQTWEMAKECKARDNQNEE